MRLGLYLHALRAARPRQIAGRARRPVTRRLFPAGALPPFTPPTGPVPLWRSPAFAPAELTGSGGERLRAFHAHYGEDVLSHARRDRAAEALASARAWIAAHPPSPGDAWHPYTTATRAGNWIAAAALEPSFPSPEVVTSLWRQLRHLALNVEDDVLGNHVVRNARALALGGVAFGNDRMVGRARALLERELAEQVLADGGHYERSPVYHLIVLRDLVEIDAALPGVVPRDLLARMRRFARALLRPDGRPALFNDGGHDLAPSLDLGDEAPPPLSVFPDTGYVVAHRPRLWLAFDCGPPAPPFLPPHAHADALSFQLWLDGHEVVADPGTSTYEPTPARARERGTASHATVAVDHLDQFTSWGAFRSGPFPAVELLEATPAWLRGRVRWRNGVTHTRTIEIGEATVTVTDALDGTGSHHVRSTLPLTADADVRARGPLAVARERWAFSDRFYAVRQAEALVLEGAVALPVELGWSIAARGAALPVA